MGRGHVCDDIACRCSGASELLASVEEELGKEHHPPAGDHTRVGEYTWVRSPCLGMCDQAPAALLQEFGSSPRDTLLGGADAVLDAARAARAVRQPAMGEAQRRGRAGIAGPGATVTVAGPDALLTARIGVVDPTSLEAYRSAGGYQALARALEIGPEAVIAEVTAARLLGRGGAAFPTGRKWQAVASEPATPHYLVCNADESEPGTFKDRVLMEGDPFAIVEAMTIAAFATGCERGFLYVRGEYPLAMARMQGAIAQARSAGLLGADVMNGGNGAGSRRFAFDIEVRRGAGAYICGEETALFNSIEGLRGEPRNKPPFPVQSGLFGKPTVVNNVETLANVLPILTLGASRYAGVGTDQSTGTRLFCVSGAVERPGLYEAPGGITARALLQLAGGVKGGRALQTILLGGAAGVFIRPDELDMVLSFEGTRAAKATLGSGVFMVVDDRVQLDDLLLRIAAFFRDESCGQCVPCRVGTVRQEEALHRIRARRTSGGARPAGGMEADIALLDEVGAAMKDASICGLGQTAYSAVESAIHRLRHFEGASA
jgi:NADH-quinone oxidoreductase subunit F